MDKVFPFVTLALYFAWAVWMAQPTNVDDLAMTLVFATLASPLLIIILVPVGAVLAIVGGIASVVIEIIAEVIVERRRRARRARTD